MVVSILLVLVTPLVVTEWLEYCIIQLLMMVLKTLEVVMEVQESVAALCNVVRTMKPVLKH